MASFKINSDINLYGKLKLNTIDYNNIGSYLGLDASNNTVVLPTPALLNHTHNYLKTVNANWSNDVNDYLVGDNFTYTSTVSYQKANMYPSAWSTNAILSIGTYVDDRFAGTQIGVASLEGSLFVRHKFYTWGEWYKIWTSYDFDTTKINNWNTAFGWGSHSSAGYLTAASLTGYATQSWVNSNTILNQDAAFQTGSRFWITYGYAEGLFKAPAFQFGTPDSGQARDMQISGNYGDYTLDFTRLNGTIAQSIRVGGVFVSNDYSGTAPVNGLYVKGAIINQAINGNNIVYTDANKQLVGLTGTQGQVLSKTSNGFAFIDLTGLQGAVGQTGLQGATGQIGMQGSTGAQGMTGESGYQGSNGQNGVQGSVGQTGLQGMAGESGYQGATGQAGYQGYQGSAGQNGLQGATGQMGYQGATGQAGVQGSTGQNGLQGSTGQTGLQGSVGQTGLQGAAGQMGYQGSAGQVGLQGSPGQTGYQGSAGQNGLQGSVGQMGYQGSSGVQGAVGLQGANGTTLDQWIDHYGYNYLSANSPNYGAGEGINTNGGYASKTQTINGSGYYKIDNNIEHVIRIDYSSDNCDIEIPKPSDFPDRIVTITNNNSGTGAINIVGDSVYFGNLNIEVLHPVGYVAVNTYPYPENISWMTIKSIDPDNTGNYTWYVVSSNMHI